MLIRFGSQFFLWAFASFSFASDLLTDYQFHWTTSPPLVAPVQRTNDPCYSIKDPTIVFHEGMWYLFCTIRSQKRTHQIEFLSFPDWEKANQSKRHILTICEGYFCAPQVFYFTPHKKWVLLFQTSAPSYKLELQPAISTTETIVDPTSWSQPVLLYEKHPENVKAWIDFWIICDMQKAYLFFTSLDGRFWRAETSFDRFPHGWNEPQVVLQDDIFEAGHVYRILGTDRYLALIEAQREGSRYYKAYTADRLDGLWQPLASTHEKPFASPANVRDRGQHWTDSFSHGELLRAGFDEKLVIDPANLQFLFQGVSDTDKEGKKYGDIPWRLGILTPRLHR